MNFIKSLFKIVIVILPWGIKRPLLVRFFGFNLSRSARIGISWVFPNHLVMEDHTNIGHFSVAIHLDRIEMQAHSIIGRNNWITGFPKADTSHFSHIKDRQPELILGSHSAITKNHHFDCTEKIEIGAFTTIAGYNSQFLTHSIDIEKNIQDAKAITIGNYCFVGTNVVVLGGSVLPDYCVLGVKSLLNRQITESYSLVAGVPAKPIKQLPESSGYFNREKGYVD
jgi:acetyltransferase-like isoleucine patch superfamily enzyme